MPLLLGLGFNPYWFIAAFIISNILYMIIMLLRGKIELNVELKELLIKKIEDIGKNMIDKSMSNEEKIKFTIRTIVLLIDELEILYAEQGVLFDEQTKAFIKAKAEEIIYGKSID